jgi:hypothetical protein
MNTNNDRDSGAAQAFCILGDGSAEITWVDDYRQGACTAKLSDNEWAVVLPQGDDIVQLHEQSHVKFSGWDSSALFNEMGRRARELFAIIEDARVDTLGGNWYRRDLHGDHGGRLLSESGRESFGADGLSGPVMAIAYGLDVPLSKVGEGVRVRFGRRIADVQTDPDPWASARLAFEIDRAYDHEPEPEPEPDPGDGQPEGQPEGGDGDGNGDGQGGEDTPDGQDTPQNGAGGQQGGAGGQGQRAQVGQALADVLAARIAAQADQGRGLNGADEDAWRTVQRSAKRQSKLRKNLAERERIDYRNGVPVPVVDDLTGRIRTESTVLAGQTVLALDSLTSSGAGRYDRVGTITPEVWRLGYGEGRVFERPARRRGRVVVAVDYSTSMGCPCAGCSTYQDYIGWSRPGWLAAQSAAAIAQASNAEVFGWSDLGGGGGVNLSVLRLDAGTQPAHSSLNLLAGSTPTAEALGYLADMLVGEANGAVGVFITDGRPNDESTAREAAQSLHAAGVRYAVVVVGRKANSKAGRSKIADIFPDAVVVGVASADDLAKLGPALADLLGA